MLLRSQTLSHPHGATEGASSEQPHSSMVRTFCNPNECMGEHGLELTFHTRSEMPQGGGTVDVPRLVS
eukprot:2459204-Amphidinium_carterae.1